jgi:hypothetical protein
MGSLSGSPPNRSSRSKVFAVDLDRINCRPALEPLAPTSGISSAALSPSGSFLDQWLNPRLGNGSPDFDRQLVHLRRAQAANVAALDQRQTFDTVR